VTFEHLMMLSFLLNENLLLHHQELKFHFKPVDWKLGQYSNMLEIQALIRILKRKGITDENEILEEVKKLKVEMEEKIKKMGREN